MLRDRNHVSQLRLAVLLFALAVFTAGCGGGEETASSVASIADVEVAATPAPDIADDGLNNAVEEPDPETAEASTDVEATSGSDGSSDEAGSGEDPVDEGELTTEEATDEDMALAFVACVREGGIDEMPDPTVLADGTVQLLPPGQQQVFAEEGFQEVAEGCVYLIEDATFFSAAPDISAIEDSLLEFAQCLRENGVEVDDPDLSKVVPGQGARIFGDDFDPQDPANADAVAGCSSLLPNAAGN